MKEVWIKTVVTGVRATPNTIVIKALIERS
jgi:hypothetical protein